MQENNPFWTFSVQLYGDNTVATQLLHWQDAFGADINLLLFAAWCAAGGEWIDEGRWPDLLALVREWQQRAIRPLRELRRYLRDANVPAIYDQVTSLELALEMRQQGELYQWWQQNGSAHTPASNSVDVLAANVAGYCRYFSAVGMAREYQQQLVDVIGTAWS